MEISTVTDRDSLNGMRSEWGELIERCPTATVYQTWEWNEAWWRAFGSGKRLLVIVARDRGRLVGIAPLYVSRHFNTPLRRLAFLGTGVTDYLDFITDGECSQEVSAALLGFLDRTRGYDLADLHHLRPESALMRLANRQIEVNGSKSRSVLIEQEHCPFVRLPESWDAFAASLGKKMRSNIGYYVRLLERSFGSTETRLATPDEIDDTLAAHFLLHQRRWNARLLPGVLGGDKVQQFHRMVSERFQARGWLRLHRTTVDGRIVATLYCFRFRDRYYYYLGGFSPELAKFSLGTTLTAGAIHEAIREGCSEFDFLRGDEPYKYRWTQDSRMNHRLVMNQPGSARSLAMLSLNRFERTVERRAKAFAEQRGRGRS